jgi:hypothetical protein
VRASEATEAETTRESCMHFSIRVRVRVSVHAFFLDFNLCLS